MTTIRNITVALLVTFPLVAMGSPLAEATSRMYCDGDYCGDYYVYDPDYRHGTQNRNYWSASLPYNYYYPYNYSYPYYSYPYYSYPTYYYPSSSYSYYPTYYPSSYGNNYTYPQYPTMQGAPQYPSDPSYKNLADYYKKLSDYYKAQSDYYKKLDDINNKK